MFDGITNEDSPGARRASSLLVSLALHSSVVLLAMGLAYLRFDRAREAAVQVTFSERHPGLPGPKSPPTAQAGSYRRQSRGLRRPITPKLQQVLFVPPVQAFAPAAPVHAAEAVALADLARVAPTAAVADGGGDHPLHSLDTGSGLSPGDSTGSGFGTGGAGTGSFAGASGNYGGDGDDAPQALSAGMTTPHPAAGCRPSKPRRPEQALQLGITGAVAVEYVVHADGHVGEVVLRTPASPAILFEAVKSWLVGCPFVPSMSGNKPLAVTINQVFTFKSGQ
jgi:Gram-negative bacterial TonB protein C-terminal